MHIDRAAADSKVVGRSKWAHQVRDIIEQVACCEAPVLVSGLTGRPADHGDYTVVR